MLIAAFGIPLTTLTTGLRGILEAYEDFKSVNLLRMMLGAANFGLPAVSVMFLGPSLSLMVTSLIIARAIVLLAHLYLVQKKLPLGWMTAKFSKNNMRNLLSFGAWMTVSNVISPLMVTMDRFIISAVLGASMVAYYTVPFEVLIRMLIIPGALSTALFPRFASMITTDRTGAKLIYKKSLKVVLAAMLPICMLCVVGSHFGLTFWLGREFADRSWLIFSILACGMFFNGMASIPFAIIQGAGNPQITARLHIVEGIVCIPMLFVFLHYFGLVGAAVIWMLRVGFDLVALLFFANRCTRIDAL
jgi:O-antigen/teichoic acid export membrane protein